MESLWLLIPLSVAMVLLIGGAFWWSVSSGQFDDLEGPAHRILADDDRTPADLDKQKPESGALTSVKPAENGER
jgi:cbb3-type cytochrome oxidase maturation protein